MALVALDGTISWACLPRFDSPAVFASILDADAGHWSLAPSGGGTVSRRYVGATMVVATQWHTDTGRVEVRDLLPLGEDERGHHIGLNAPAGIIRVVSGLAGKVTIDTELALRPEYGLVHPQLVHLPEGVAARGGANAAMALSPQGWEIDAESSTMRATVEVVEGARVAFGLLLHDPWTGEPDMWTQDELLKRADDTVAAWESWSELHQSYDGPYADLVSHSGRVLQALTYAPSGAVVAAPTTSLPESPGGGRNWDYRYAWVRDASLTLEALWVAACLRDLADAAAERWREPDQGIWEIRGEPRHFTHSKLMCWVAVDRACQLADRIGAGEDQVERWRSAREEIHGEIIGRAWNQSLGAFTQSFDSDELDASVLMMAIVGFLAADDPRLRATVEAIDARLTDEQGFVYRYRGDDDLDGDEGTFALCTFWLAHCWALLGDVDRARALCDRMVSCANDVGLFSEEIAPGTGALLGNFPQAFTHVGLINAAWAIHLAEGGDDNHTV